MTSYSGSVQYWAQQDARAIEPNIRLGSAPSVLVTLLEERARARHAETGAYLQPLDDNDPLRDLRDELLDALVYAKQESMRPRPRVSPRLYQRLLALTSDVVTLCTFPAPDDLQRQIAQLESQVHDLEQRNALLEHELFQRRDM